VPRLYELISPADYRADPVRRTAQLRLSRSAQILKRALDVALPRPRGPIVVSWTGRGNAPDQAAHRWPLQVLGRSDIPFGEMVQLDYLQFSSWLLAGDVKLNAKSIPQVLFFRARRHRRTQ
jgi:hypothetical protein